MGRMSKKEQREYISRRAPELARTGKFTDWLAVERHLRWEENLPAARQELDSQYIRQELDRLCRETRKDA